MAYNGLHLRFLARTVLVRNNEVDVAYRGLERILRSDGVLERARRMQYYEKPYQKRNRLSFEKCKRIYDADMARKIEFIIRKKRVPPFVYD